jgi:hypothetical protein
LLNHYWTAADHIAVREAQIEDWIDDLIEFGPKIVAEACRRWRNTESRRPTPADIRKFCIEDRALALPPSVEEGPWPKWMEDIWGPEPAGPARRAASLRELPAAQAQGAAMVEEGHRLADEWARRHDFQDFDSYLDAGGSYAEAIRMMTGATGKTGR